MRRLAWLVAGVVLAVAVAIQVTGAAQRANRFVALADVPIVAAGADVLVGVAVIQQRIHGNDYRRAAFGDAWTDDTSAPRWPQRLRHPVPWGLQRVVIARRMMPLTSGKLNPACRNEQT